MATTLQLDEKWRANCADCKKRFNWRDTREEAEQDADDHQDDKDHTVRIEKKTTKHSLEKR